ncbi:MAG: DUF3152 domain-containing protein [Actinomycetota bacterium]
METLVARLLLPALLLMPLDGAISTISSPSHKVARASQHKFPNAHGDSRKVGEGPLRRFVVETERATKVDPDLFADRVERILFDHGSWAGKRVALKRVARGTHAFNVTLATRDTTDRLCYPYRTNGIFSCYNNGRAVINVWRWRNGADSYGKQIRRYRRYLINHEVGHALGQSHRSCTGDGDPAPTMVQQTKSLYGCTRNEWPLRWERRTLDP